jgi:FixJ family two-component response regulator
VNEVGKRYNPRLLSSLLTSTTIAAVRRARRFGLHQQHLLELYFPRCRGKWLTVLLMTGQSIKDIAATLGIADDSTRRYLKRIYRKTGTHRQTDLVRIASQALTADGRK